MFSWTPYAFVRIVIFFGAGILLGIYLPGLLSIHQLFILFFLFATIFIALVIVRWHQMAKLINPALFGLLALALAGYIRIFYSTDSHDTTHFIHITDSISHYQVVVSKQAQQKENSWKVEADVRAIRVDARWITATGKVLLYFSKNSFSKPFTYGDVLLLAGSPVPLSEPANPGEFNYKRFLTFRKIYHQQFLRTGDVFLMRHEPPSTLMDYALRARVQADEVLHRYVSGAREQAIASALVLGVTDGLDNELLSAYAATGSMHVLAVSGLHVGIIYWLILLFFKPLNNSQRGRWALALISLFILWGYAFITGLSPSVLRAVTMFSFVAMARPWGQRTNIYNTLAASAFCLLLWEPYLVMSVGFQLSYLAVLGIVYLQPILYRLWDADTWLMDKVWQITCVSIAAQVATFSLGLLYFHQFPVYFLFSNLFVIPGSFIVLVLGIAVVLLSFIPWVAGALGFLLEWTIRALNVGVFSVEAFPFSLIENIYITTFQCWLLMASLLFIILVAEYRKLVWVVPASACLVLFSLTQWSHFYAEVNTNRLVVYRVTGQSAWEILDHGKAYFFADSLLLSDRERLRFHIRPNRLQRGIGQVFYGQEQEFSRTLPGCQVVVWRGVRILHIRDRNHVLPDNLQVDYLIVGQNALHKLSALPSLKFKTLILDSSNSFYFADRIIREARNLPVHVHSVLDQGAFDIKL